MKYKGIILTLLGVIIAILLSQLSGFHDFVNSLSALSYFGAIIIGIFFVSSITVATSIIALAYMAQIQDPFLVALAAGFGALIGDMLIFRFVRENLTDELKSIIDKIPYFKNRHIFNIFHHKYLAWFLPVAGLIIIASPFPDELGVSLMGISKINPWRFAILSFILNTAGIYVLLTIISR